jgi:hypothetical protein
MCAFVCVCVRARMCACILRVYRRRTFRASKRKKEESAYDDRMSLEHLCAKSRAERAHARRASDHNCEPGAASLASLAVLALAPHSAVGADGGAPA